MLLLLYLLRRQFPGVAVFRLAGFTKVDLQELCAEGFDLLFHDRTRIESCHACAQPFRRGDRLQTGDPGTNDEYLGGLQRTGGRHHHRKDRGQPGRRQQNHHVTRQTGL